jgi:hypothetical protein
MKIDFSSAWDFWRDVDAGYFRHLESREFKKIAENAHHFSISDMLQVIHAFRKELAHRKWLSISKEGRKEQLDRIQALLDSGTELYQALLTVGLSGSKFKRWSELYRIHGVEGLADRRKGNAGRPRKDK